MAAAGGDDGVSFFEDLENKLELQIEPQYFEIPRKFRSCGALHFPLTYLSYLIEVIEILGKKIEQTNDTEEDPLLSLQVYESCLCLSLSPSLSLCLLPVILNDLRNKIPPTTN
jgi:hypothetical protein